MDDFPLRVAFAALLLVMLCAHNGGMWRAADCTRFGPFDLQGPGCAADAAHLHAASECKRKVDTLAASFSKAPACTASCYGKNYTLYDFKAAPGAGGSCTYTAKYHCCVDVSHAVPAVTGMPADGVAVAGSVAAPRPARVQLRGLTSISVACPPSA